MTNYEDTVRGVLLCALFIGTLPSCGSQANRALLSDASFDRCFDMDFNPDESPSDKSYCWREWLDTRYAAEPDDKVRYAEMRRAEIAQGIFVPGPPSAASTYSHRPRLFDTDVFDKHGEADAGDTDTNTACDSETSIKKSGDESFNISAKPTPVRGQAASAAVAREPDFLKK